MTTEDKNFVKGLLEPINLKIQIFSDNQDKFAEKQDIMIEKQQKTELVIDRLKRKIEGNGSPGIQKLLEMHLECHQEETEKKLEESNQKLQRVELDRRKQKNELFKNIFMFLGGGTGLFLLQKIFDLIPWGKI